MRLKNFYLFLLLSCAPCVLHAAAVSPPETHHKPDLDFSGYISGSYNYLQRSNYFTSNVLDRSNDIAENGFRLQQAYFNLSSNQLQGFGGVFETIIGLDAYNSGPGGWNADVFNLQNIGLVVPQAYLQYRYASYTVQVGLMSSLAGLESYVYTRNTNFSHSIVDGYAQSGAHVGVRIRKQLDDAFELVMGLVNGWSSIRQPGRLDALELGLTYHLSDKLSVTFDTFTGNQYMSDGIFTGPMSMRKLLDIFGTYQLSKQLSLAWNIDYGMQSKAALPYGVIGEAVWAGVAGYVNVQFDEKWRSSLRGEVFNDSDGYRTGVPQYWKELTLTFGYTPIKHLEVIAETRHDFSNVNAYTNKNGVGTNSNQQSYALEALYQFA